mmetsp:Transcript_33661/g.69525  ORF Transcript_33661/g.69525 Transcript_33661/m.69525 type:complete len:289 (-) Transcript_33661:63-929(-)
MSIALLANITCTMQTPTSTIPPPDESIWGEEFSKRVLRAPNFADSFRTANAINYRRSSSLDYKDVVSVLVVHDNRKPVWCGPPCTWENGIAHRVMGGELSLAQADVRNARKKQLKCVFDLPLGTFGRSGAESPSTVRKGGAAGRSTPGGRAGGRGWKQRWKQSLQLPLLQLLRHACLQTLYLRDQKATLTVRLRTPWSLSSQLLSTWKHSPKPQYGKSRSRSRSRAGRSVTDGVECKKGERARAGRLELVRVAVICAAMGCCLSNRLPQRRRVDADGVCRIECETILV